MDLHTAADLICRCRLAQANAHLDKEKANKEIAELERDLEAVSRHQLPQIKPIAERLWASKYAKRVIPCEYEDLGDCEPVMESPTTTAQLPPPPPFPDPPAEVSDEAQMQEQS